jgi:uncharacterized DUF497 family protein
MDAPISSFDWDPVKNRENLRKHGVRFETASLVFEDPWIMSRKDISHGEAEERYNALGEIAPGVILFVVFTWRQREENEIIRLISARAASALEKRNYEEARSRAEAGYRRDRRQNRRYDGLLGDAGSG